MKRPFILLFFLLFGFFQPVYSQNTIIDSLQSLSENKELPDTSRIMATAELGFAYRTINPSKTLAYASQALLEAQDKDYLRGEGRANSVLGVYYWTQGDFTTAFEYFTKANSQLASAGDKLNQSKVINNLGIIHHHFKDYEKALEHYLQALDLKNELRNEVSAAMTMIQLGNLYGDQDQHELAREHYEKARDICSEYNHLSGLSASLNNLGETYIALDMPEEGISFLTQSLQIKKQTGNLRGESITLHSIGHVYEREGMLQESMQMYLDALKIREQLNDPILVGHSLASIAMIQLQQWRMEEAIKNLDRAYDLAERYKAFDLKLQVLEGYYRYYKVTNQPQISLRYFETYQTLSDSIYNAEISTRLSQIQTRFELDQIQKEYELQSELLEREKANARLTRTVLIITLVSLVVILVSFYLVRRSNDRLKKLNEEIEAQQQTILDRSIELEEANTQIKERNSELNRTINQLESTQDQLIESEKMASIGVLAAGIGHEINNPLNFIKVGADSLEEFLNKHPNIQNSESKRLLSIISEGVERTTRIVDTLNQFTGSQPNRVSEVNLKEVIENCLVILNFNIEKKATVQTDFQTTMKVKGNQSQLHQVFLNLISNALDAINGQGEIIICAYEQNGQLIVSIKDNGHGIPDHLRGKGMEPFFTTKDPGKGTGLGLWITYKVIQEHLGKVKINSSEGKGTEVTIALPLKG
jgi:signal transduction histidine kinase